MNKQYGQKANSTDTAIDFDCKSFFFLDFGSGWGKGLKEAEGTHTQSKTSHSAACSAPLSLPQPFL